MGNIFLLKPPIVGGQWGLCFGSVARVIQWRGLRSVTRGPLRLSPPPTRPLIIAMTSAEPVNTSRRAGNPGHFTGERLQYLEDSLPQYIAFKHHSREKKMFLQAFLPSFLDLFPLDDYPLPTPHFTIQLEPKTDAELAAMPGKDRAKYKKAKARRERTPGQQLRDVSIFTPF